MHEVGEEFHGEVVCRDRRGAKHPQQAIIGHGQTDGRLFDDAAAEISALRAEVALDVFVLAIELNHHLAAPPQVRDDRVGMTLDPQQVRAHFVVESFGELPALVAKLVPHVVNLRLEQRGGASLRRRRASRRPRAPAFRGRAAA